MTNELLNKLYTNPKSGVFFASEDRFYKEIKKHYPEIKKKDVKDYLESNLTRSLFKESRQKFERNPTIVHSFSYYQMDLLQMTQYSLPEKNDGVNYLLCVISVLSKKLYVEPLKTKTGAEVKTQFLKILNRLDFPMTHCFSDKGSEFYNTALNDIYKKYKIEKWNSNDTEIKAGVVERAQKTLKMKIIKFLHWSGDDRYIDNLQEIVEGQNAAFNRSIGRSANSVQASDEYELLKKTVYPHLLKERHKKDSIKIDDNVRVRQKRKAFERNYDIKWSNRLYQVDKKIDASVPVYELRDDANKKTKKVFGKYYKEEINKFNVDEDTSYPIKILGYKKVKNKKMVRIVYLGYEDEGETLIPESNLTK
uniref:Integrase catalytic domain-containing protein n=1 Tax=Panagrolaimus superbus TaxID=310955 RepID=A0A914YQG7_9BILA